MSEGLQNLQGGYDDMFNGMFNEVRGRIQETQYQAFKAVNKELINLYWDIGKTISERQSQDATTGGRRTLIQRLSKDLQREFPGISGFSVSNLWKINNFYEAYATSERLSPLVREIAWSHNLVILDRCHDPLEREFYIRMTRKYGWTRNVLLHQIETKSYERTLMGQTNFKQTLTPEQLSRAKLAVKDEYTFDFLDLGDDYSERELERALIVRVEEFLREMGGMFAFVSSQFRLEVANKEYFIDLLLYHRRLKSLVAVGLKVGEFQPEYVCKMQFYLAVLDDTVREEGENPSIGMILCKQKDRTIVEYALRDARKPIGVATYQTVQQLPKELEGQLPSPEEIAKLLEIE